MNIDLILEEINKCSKSELKELALKLSLSQKKVISYTFKFESVKEDVELMTDDDNFKKFTPNDVIICTERYFEGKYQDPSICHWDNVINIMTEYAKEKGYIL